VIGTPGNGKGRFGGSISKKNTKPWKPGECRKDRVNANFNSVKGIWWGDIKSLSKRTVRSVSNREGGGKSLFQKKKKGSCMAIQEKSWWPGI